jgi:hypothetical protein
LVPLALALVIAGQPIGEIMCGVACESGHAASHVAAAPRAHACHHAEGTDTDAAQRSVAEHLTNQDAYAGSPCRQSTIASLGEDACVWARESCPTLVTQKTAVAPPAEAFVATPLTSSRPGISPPPPRSMTVGDAAVQRSTTLRI